VRCVRRATFQAETLVLSPHLSGGSSVFATTGRWCQPTGVRHHQTELIEPGDLVFCNGRGIVAWAIRACERLSRDWDRALGHQQTRFNHVAIADHQLDDGDWALIQALGSGVVMDRETGVSRLSQYHHYSIVSCPADRQLTLEFARAQEGRRYGFVSIISFLITMFSPGFVNVMLPQTWICSALVAESLRYGAWLHDWPDIYQVTPAQLWLALESKPPTL
jgi:hypothetical protein